MQLRAAVVRPCSLSGPTLRASLVSVKCLLPRRVLARVAQPVSAATGDHQEEPHTPHAAAVEGPRPTSVEQEPLTALPVIPSPILLPPPADTVEDPTAVFLHNADEMPAEDIKAALLDSLYGTERGLAARSEVRAEINELISQLEAKNPTPNPTETLDKLEGTWKLVYTSSRAALSILALGRLPLVRVGDLTQTIDVATNTVENKVQLSGALSSTTFSTSSSFEVRSPKRLQFKLESGTISTPSITGDIELPDSISVMGQSVDLRQINDALRPVSQGLSDLLAQAGSLLAKQPDLQIPLRSDRGETWQLNTYVDDDLRIMRGDGGSTFIATKVYSALPRAI